MSCRLFYNQPSHQTFFSELEKQLNNELLKSQTNEEIFYTPNSNIIEQQDGFIIELELAGVNKQDIKIDIEKSNLIISGENKRKFSLLSNTNSSNNNNTTSPTDKPLIENFEGSNKNNQLTSTKSKPELQEKHQYLVREIESGKFRKVISIKDQYLDLENIKATFENGILSIKLLKKEPVSLKVNLF
ncbi:G-protein-coupled receptor family protein [Tieghemostelium lacteum]|uniref:G-protein-coupled receptor family protein n=1 Tax=Tieghemostelium lacteum TaxID=361077 RepID=A0A151Z348_TIELA|nr:G-protein-coupled receptor family protein [Tieghemostelium lacteum]|eukprot:KYQ88386.1 G-protein-coupled receptor family protein [Tieghemostelium lacteum]